MKISKAAAVKEQGVAQIEIEEAAADYDRREWDQTHDAHFDTFDSVLLSDMHQEQHDPVSLIAAAEGRLAGEGVTYTTTSNPDYWGEQAQSEQWVAWAMDKIRDAKLQVEYAKMRAEAIVRRAERRLQFTEARLWPHCEVYAYANPPKKGKTIHVEGTDQRLQWRRQPDRLHVQDERAAIRSLEDQIGFDKAQALGYTRIKEELSVSMLKKGLKDGDVTLPDGCQIVEGQDKLILSKGRKQRG